MKNITILVACICAFLLPHLSCKGEEAPPISAEGQKKVDAILKEVQQWASDPLIVKAVKAQNEGLPAEFAGMTQAKWETVSVLDPLVRNLAKNEVAAFLKSKMREDFTQSSVNDASGFKVGFFVKPKNWCHKGLPQFETPMSGKPYQGPVQVHPATGALQLQITTPVMDSGKPIGVIVVGIKASALQ